MNGISPLPSNLPDQIPREAAILSELCDSAKIGVKRPSQDEALEAPELKKTNLDPETAAVPVSMTVDAKSEPEDAFEMSSSGLTDNGNGPSVSYYCKYHQVILAFIFRSSTLSDGFLLSQPIL